LVKGDELEVGVIPGGGGGPVSTVVDSEVGLVEVVEVSRLEELLVLDGGCSASDCARDWLNVVG
jgi:hypothetical protein